MSRMSCQISSDNKKKHAPSLWSMIYLIQYVPFWIVRQSRVTNPPDGAEVGHSSRRSPAELTMKFKRWPCVKFRRDGHGSQPMPNSTRWWPKVTCFRRVGKLRTKSVSDQICYKHVAGFRHCLRGGNKRVYTGWKGRVHDKCRVSGTRTRQGDMS